MTEEQRELLEEARDSIAAAKLLLDGGFLGYAASRAYYAMFYVAEAFWRAKGYPSQSTPLSSQPSASVTPKRARFR